MLKGEKNKHTPTSIHIRSNQLLFISLMNEGTKLDMALFVLKARDLYLRPEGLIHTIMYLYIIEIIFVQYLIC